MARARVGSSDRPSGQGPAIGAVTLWESSGGTRAQLLSDEERAQLALIASVVRFKKNALVYLTGHQAEAVFVIISGVVKAFRTAANGSEQIAAFLFADDLFGLSEEGKYANSAKAVTAVTAYRLPVAALKGMLVKDAGLEFHVICKLCHELREAQRHAFLLGRRRALTKIVMFLQLLEQHQIQAGGVTRTSDIYLPMDRSDIGEYVGISPEAVSRSFRTLSARGIIKIRDRRHIKIIDRARFEALATEHNARGKM
jgi:CRP-like cAMP-binding protein